MTLASRISNIKFLRGLLVFFALFGGVCTMLRWSWLPTGLEHTPTHLGLFLFEGWLAFLCLLIIALGVLFIHTYGMSIYKLTSVASLIALISCVLFVYRAEIEKLDVAVWIVAAASTVCLLLSIVIFVKGRKRITE